MACFSLTLMSSTKTTVGQQENPLVNIILNVLAPVLILSYCSKEGKSLGNLGSHKAMILALAIPMAYGIWHLIQHKKLNIFSAVGIGNVLLTGLISIYLYSTEDPIVRQNTALLYGIKEAVQPLILGSLFLLTAESASPLFNTLIYNEGILDLSRINIAVKEKGNEKGLQQLLWSSNLLIVACFWISAVMNFGLACYFLGDLDSATEDWNEHYNANVAKISGWGFLVVVAPLIVVGGFIFARMLKALKSLTGIESDRFLRARKGQ